MICKIEQKLNVVPSGQLNFQVMDKTYHPARRFIVKLESRSCDCGLWDISGIPYVHGMAVILYARHTIDEYILHYFTTQAYINTYRVMFNPIPDPCAWASVDRPDIHPPIIQKKIGRPKKVRK